MRIIKTLAFCSMAALLWNCNDSTPPTSATQTNRQVVRGEDMLAKLAATQAGYSVMPVDPQPEKDDNFFTPELAKAMRDAGVCENLILIAEEILGSIGDSNATFLTSPRFMEAVTCLDTKAKSFSSEPSGEQILGLVGECLCNGTGTLFFAPGFSRYSIPRPPGGYRTPTTTSTPYSTPQTSTGYSAPSNPGGQGYSAPSL
jgi:hypothetical protein